MGWKNAGSAAARTVFLGFVLSVACAEVCWECQMRSPRDRSFMVFPEDTIGAYLDWRTQEIGIAAVLSGDEALMADYREGDVYYGLAKLCGLTFGLPGCLSAPH